MARATVAALWIACILAHAAQQASAAGVKSFVVTVADGELDQVEAAYRARGFEIQSVNRNHGVLKVAPPPTEVPMATASPVASGPSSLPPWARQQAAALSPGDTAAGEAILPRGARAAARAAAAISPSGEAEAAQASWPPPPAARGAASAAPSIASVVAALQEVPGVQSVEPQVQAYLMAGRGGRTLQQLAQPAAVCPAGEPKSGPDTDLGKNGAEGVPYGIKMVQADDPGMIAISKAAASKVLFCIIDTGLDRTNWEFAKTATTSGCVPNTVRAGGSKSQCAHQWWADSMGHGTHTSGTIGALRNGRGVVGVSAEGAQIYHFNAFGDSDTFDFSDIINAWDDCVAELDARKAAAAAPDMKMVISMSLGSGGDMTAVRDAVKRIASKRPDVLFVAAAGNSGSNQVAYPAGYDEVVSVGAVDWKMNKASFSQFNPDVEWAAPGVLTLSTIPTAGAASSSYNLRPSISVTTVAGVDDTFAVPPPVVMPGGATGASLSAKVVDCGLGLTKCAGATGKVCLIQRGQATFCSKVANCLEGGGVAAIIYEKEETADSCAPLTGATLSDPSCNEPAAGWPMVLTASLAQGKAFKALLAKQPGLTVQLDTSAGPQSPPLEFLSGTSMATPTAAGVAGLVWSAHTTCSAQELRQAISASALDRGTPGRDDLFGYGIVQAAAAHTYLEAHPCTGKAAAPAPVPTPAPSQPTRKLRVTFAPGVTAKLGQKAVLPFTLAGGCTAGQAVVASVVVGPKLAECPAGIIFSELRSTRAALSKEVCTANGGSYTFATTAPGAAVGHCHRLHIRTTDRQTFTSTIKFV